MSKKRISGVDLSGSHKRSKKYSSSDSSNDTPSTSNSKYKKKTEVDDISEDAINGVSDVVDRISWSRLYQFFEVSSMIFLFAIMCDYCLN